MGGRRRKGFRGRAGTARPYVGGLPVGRVAARTCRRGAGTPPYGCNSRKRCRGGIYAVREFMWDAVRRLLFFFSTFELAIRLKMYPRCRAWTF